MPILTVADKRALEAHGIETRCRCPKPCMRHSHYYLGEALVKIQRGQCPNIISCSACGVDDGFDVEDENRLLKEAMRYLMDLRKRDEPTQVEINYTIRRKVRGMLGRKLASRVGL
jgi:hypothetical protein